MAEKLTQKDRPIQLITPLGEDKLVARSFEGREALSELYSFTVEALSEEKSIDPADIIGKNVAVQINSIGGTHNRTFSGVVNRFVRVDLSEGRSSYPVYRLEFVPWLWLLTRTSDCRIFQQKSVTDIIKKVVEDFSFSGQYKDNTQGSFPSLEYCVQYRETSANFLRRLMEEYGITFFFDYETNKHTLNAANAPSAFQPIQGRAEKIRWEPARSGAIDRDDEYVSEWVREFEVQSRKWIQTDYNFKTPNTSLLTDTDTIISNSLAAYSMFDYPGRYTTSGDGRPLTKVRMEEDEANYDVIYGRSDVVAFAPGHKFELTEHPKKAENGKYVLTAVTHHARQGAVGTSGSAGEEAFTYENSFTCIPANVHYRPPRVTPKSYVHGVQPAVVVGPSGEEIYTDEFGRVKVQFFWDREAKHNENSSCWIRVSQPIAGKGWGAIYLPRIGQEVLVDFMEGDPDRPVVVGRVYNAECTVPYSLPGEQTKSTWKSYSSKGGGGFNEIRFEDKKGSEQVFIHAEKDLDLRIKAKRREYVGASDNLTVGGDKLEKVGGDMHLKVTGDQNEKIGGTVSLTIGSNRQEKVSQNYAVDAGTEVYLKAGSNMVFESGTAMTMKVGGNFIKIDGSGVTIVGSMVKINSGGSAGSGTPCMPAAPKEPEAADDAQPGQMSTPPSVYSAKPPATFSPQALVLKSAADSGAPFCEI